MGISVVDGCRESSRPELWAAVWVGRAFTDLLSEQQ